MVLILCGGRSSRMGEPKHSVRLSDGRPMIAHVLDAVLPLRLPVVLSTASPPPTDLIPFGFKIIEDAEPYEGPLVAITHALEALKADRLLVVGCDQPNLRAETLSPLLHKAPHDQLAFYCGTDGCDYSPFPGVFPRTLKRALQVAVESGERSPRRWLKDQCAAWITLEPDHAKDLRSVNTLEDLREL